jgi:serine/threonine protein kinase
MLGKGSFGKVKRFIDKNSLKQFAGKIFKKQLIDKKGPNVRNQIYKEISLSLKLKHKHAIKIFDYHSTDHKVYVFMKYCFGVLQEILDSVPLRKLPKSQSHKY